MKYTIQNYKIKDIMYLMMYNMYIYIYENKTYGIYVYIANTNIYYVYTIQHKCVYIYIYGCIYR